MTEDALEKSKPKQQLSGSLESLASISSTNSSAERRVKVNLPKLELTKFGGKIHLWQEFWDGFCSSVQENDDLANVDKFKYVRSLLEELAKSVVAGIPLTSSDYAAMKLLQDRYGDPVVIQRAHINQLVYLSPVYSERTSQDCVTFTIKSRRTILVWRLSE